MDLSAAAGSGPARSRRGGWPRRRWTGRSTSRAGPLLRATPAAPRARGARPAPRHAPHRLGRLVHGGAGAGDRGALRRRRRGPALAAARAAHPVRRLRRLAAGLARGRGAGAAARLLAGAAGRRARPARPARPTGRGRPSQTFRGARLHVPWTPASRAALAQPRPPARGDPVHGPPRGVPGPPRPLHRAGGLRGRLAHRQPQPGRDRAADRLLRQHPGAARRPARRSRLPRAAGPRARRPPWRPTPTRTCPSSSWWRSCGRSGTSPTTRSSR